MSKGKIHRASTGNNNNGRKWVKKTMKETLPEAPLVPSAWCKNLHRSVIKIVLFVCLFSSPTPALPPEAPRADKACINIDRGDLGPVATSAGHLRPA